MTPVALALTVLLAPLGSAVVIALFLRRQGTLASAVSLAAALAVAVAGLGLALGGDAYRFSASAEWLKLGSFSLSLGFKFDDLAALMLSIVGMHQLSAGHGLATSPSGGHRHTGDAGRPDSTAHSHDLDSVTSEVWNVMPSVLVGGNTIYWYVLRRDACGGWSVHTRYLQGVLDSPAGE